MIFRNANFGDAIFKLAGRISLATIVTLIPQVGRENRVFLKNGKF
jgi:hypothetical protein